MKHVPCKISETRELTDKELTMISRAMGDTVRLQSLNVADIIQANLKAEFASRHKDTSGRIKAGKPVAA